MDYTTLISDGVASGDNEFCAVVAVASVLDVSYEDASQLLSYYGRRFGKGTNFDTMTRPALESMGIGLKLQQKWAKTIRTLERVIPRNKTYLVRTGGYTNSHILAIVNGVVRDWSAGRCNRVQEIYEIEY